MAIQVDCILEGHMIVCVLHIIFDQMKTKIVTSYVSQVTKVVAHAQLELLL